MTAEPRLFRDIRGILLESIFWDDRRDELVWVDITAGTVHRGRLDGAVDGSDDRVVALPPPCSAIQPAPGGGYVAALRDSVVLLDTDLAITRTLASVTHAHDGIRFNEGKVDPFGRFVVGAMDVTAEAPDAALYSFEPDGRVRVLRGGFATANGMEWSDAGDVMYVTDTAVRTVYRGAYGPDGDLGELEPLLVGRSSDGLALDTDGRFWNGVYGDGQVVRREADGAVSLSIDVPAPNVTSVAFGGPERDVLFVATARENLTEEQLARHPLSGGLFRLDGLATGRPVHSFDSRAG